MKELIKKDIASLLPKRPKDANKGTFGKVLVIAGSENFPGAAYLCCDAAYRVGAGLVTLATKLSVKIIVSRNLPEVTFLSFAEVFKKLSEYDVILIGPGLGQEESTIKFVEQLLKEKLSITVIDGDGLNILSKIDNWWKKVNGKLVLTPHPGEMARLTGLTVEQIKSDREKVVIRSAQEWNLVVVLKGANTVIVSPSAEVAVSSFANPVLATAGTGDVLSGMIAGFIAQGLSLFDAASVGVYIHGLAGEMLSKKMGDAGAKASDLLPFLPRAIQKLKQSKFTLHSQTSDQSG